MSATDPLPEWLIHKAGDALHERVNLDSCDHCEGCEHERAAAGDPGPARECNGDCDYAAALVISAVLPDLRDLATAERDRYRAALTVLANDADEGTVRFAREALNPPAAEPTGLCDGCDTTGVPVTASGDGRGQFCPTCLPIANTDDPRVDRAEYEPRTDRCGACPCRPGECLNPPPDAAYNAPGDEAGIRDEDEAAEEAREAGEPDVYPRVDRAEDERRHGGDPDQAPRTWEP